MFSVFHAVSRLWLCEPWTCAAADGDGGDSGIDEGAMVDGASVAGSATGAAGGASSAIRCHGMMWQLG